MNILNKLTVKNLKLNKKRTVVTVIGIILSVALISALSSLVVSFQNSMINYEKVNTGNFHTAFTDLKLEDLDKFENNRQLESAFFTKEVGYAKIDEIKNEDKPYAYVTAYDYDSLENLGLILIEGRKPKTSKEILIPRHLKTNGRVDYKVGDTIKLNIGSRLTKDGYNLDQFNPYIAEKETFKGKKEVEYKVVGIIERPSYKIEDYSAPGYTFITCLDTKDEGKYNAYVKYTKKVLNDNYQKAIANILGVDEDLYIRTHSNYNYESEDAYKKDYDELAKQLDNSHYGMTSTNKTLISLEGGESDDPSMQALLTVATIVVLIIIATSVFCIKNSFSISITEKTKQYGMLASVGSTKKQIKKNVLYEAFILGLIGIPLGILGGLFASYILIIVCNYLLSDTLNIDLNYSISLLAIILSVILGAITIYLSAISSARKASRISPISAIRSNDDIKIKSKKIKSPKIVKKLFGIGGDVSYKNLKRNNKKYRTTVISIIVCVSVFIALYSFMTLAFKSVGIAYGTQNYNIEISLNIQNKENFDNVKKQLLNLDGYKQYSFNRSFYFEIENPPYTKEYSKITYGGENSEEHVETAVIPVYSVGNEEYNRYLKKLRLNTSEFVNKGILINNDIEYIYDDTTNTIKKYELDIFNYNVGSKINGKIVTESSNEKDRESFEIEIGHITSERPLGLENSYGSSYIIVSDELAEKYLKDYRFDLNADVENADKFQDEAENILTSIGDDYHIFNVDKEAKAMQSLFTLIAIFLYGFITVIALIGITNIFNTITTNMELRSREFAMLKSIGMTKKEFNRMVRLESLFYGTKSLIIGIPIGCVLSYFIYKALMNSELGFAYNLPITAIIISIIAVYLLVSCIMKFSINKISKQNTIETIRNDNI